MSDLPSARFTKINESFDCVQCGRPVPPAQSTCRDHCPSCLFSVHVDINPGDRQATCGGLLRPVAYSQHKKKGAMIHYRCDACGAAKVNRFLEWDGQVADDLHALLRLASVTR